MSKRLSNMRFDARFFGGVYSYARYRFYGAKGASGES